VHQVGDQTNINWLVCITERVCLLRGTDWGPVIKRFTSRR